MVGLKQIYAEIRCKGSCINKVRAMMGVMRRSFDSPGSTGESVANREHPLTTTPHVKTVLWRKIGGRLTRTPIRLNHEKEKIPLKPEANKHTKTSTNSGSLGTSASCLGARDEIRGKRRGCKYDLFLKPINF